MKFNKPDGTKVFCLTPVANEAYGLDRFLKCASLWADHIVVGYQESMDNTLEILKNYEKVTIVNSPNKDWNELVMRSLLYEEARKIEAGRRIMLNLDADELLSANYMESAEWDTILNLPVGSVIRIPWCNLQADVFDYLPGNMIEVGFVDDGRSALSGTVMHMGRVPWPDYDIRIMRCSEIKLLHYAAVNPERYKSKHRWYQAYEKVGKSEFGANIYRKYKAWELESPIPVKVKDVWFKGYNDQQIDVTSIAYSYDYTHDHRILDFLNEFGTKYFRMCNIWDKDWVQFATGKKENPERFGDPRNRFDRMIFRYFRWSAVTRKTVFRKLIIGIADGLLKVIGYSS